MRVFNMQLMRRLAATGMGTVACAMLSSRVFASPSQEDVFKSISQNVGESNADTGIVLLVMLLASMLTISLVLLGQRRKNGNQPAVLNNPKKLTKEVVRQLDVTKREMKKLEKIAEEKGFATPLLLMICPSLMSQPAEKEKAHG